MTEPTLPSIASAVDQIMALAGGMQKQIDNLTTENSSLKVDNDKAQAVLAKIRSALA